MTHQKPRLWKTLWYLANPNEQKCVGGMCFLMLTSKRLLTQPSEGEYEMLLLQARLYRSTYSKEHFEPPLPPASFPCHSCSLFHKDSKVLAPKIWLGCQTAAYWPLWSFSYCLLYHFKWLSQCVWLYSRTVMWSVDMAQATSNLLMLIPVLCCCCVLGGDVTAAESWCRGTSTVFPQGSGCSFIFA